MSNLFLCVDCGGTKTSAVITNAAGAIVGRGSGGPSNITYLSVEAFILAVKEAVGTALKAATSTSPASSEAPPTTSSPPTSSALPPVGLSPFAAVWFGISGADSPAAIAKVTAPLSTLLGVPLSRLAIANDTHLLAAPLHGLPSLSHAVAIIAGTGSIAVSFRRKEGAAGGIEELGRVGGWGWILGDEGGGYDVGRETLRQILLAQDRASVRGAPRQPSVLADRVLAKFGVQDVLEILGGVYMADPAPGALVPLGEERELRNIAREKRISSLPPLVFEAAFEDKDPLALAILQTAAGHLAEQIAVLLGEGEEPSARTIDVTTSVISFGGSLVGIEAYRNLILDDLALRGFIFSRVVFIDDAAATGATMLAAAYSTKS